MTERVNRIIGQILRSVVSHRQSNWEELLPWCEYAYNDMVQASTCETPFYLNYGHHPIAVSDTVLLSGDHASVSKDAGDWLRNRKEAIRVARDCIQDALDKQAHHADRSRRDSKIRKGDKVLVHRDFLTTPVSRDQPCSKLKPRWMGPFPS